jgi:eukaryotic translation initiation factor 2C
MSPNLQFPFNSRSFFTPDNKQSIGGGMELWRGYFQSIRPSQDKWYLNVDISTGVMFKEGPLIQLCLEYLDDRNPGPRDPKRLSPARLHDRDRISLQRFLVNLRVSASHGGRTQTRPIQKLTALGANANMFTLRQASISVADYFRAELNTPLRYPEVICVEVSSWYWK